VGSLLIIINEVIDLQWEEFATRIVAVHVVPFNGSFKFIWLCTRV